jgi:predicted phosphoribosyltransferase
LAAALLSYRNQHPIILALPRGGVPVAAEVAKALRASLDIILVRKIGAPVAPELAVGAVVDGASPTIVSNPEIIRLTGTSEMQFQRICKEELAEIERRRHLFLGNRPPIDPRGRVVIVIDDGIATGATTRAALRAIRTRQPKKLVLAVPVGATNAINELRDEVDDVICLEKLEPFGSVGYFYSDFRQLTDQDVIEILDRFSPTDTAANK